MMIYDGRPSAEHATSHFGAAIPEGFVFDKEIEKWDRHILAEGKPQIF